MPEKMPQFEKAEKPLKEKKGQASYWALAKYPSEGMIDSKINLSKRKKALQKIKEMGWENFEDFEIHGIKINSIIKGSRERKDLWEKYAVFGGWPTKAVETIAGQIDLSGPVFGAKPETYNWQAVLEEGSITPEKTFFTLDLALYDEKKHWATRESAEEIISQIEKNIKKNDLDISFPHARSLGQEALRQALPGIFKEIKKYIWEKCYPMAAIDDKVANLEFKMNTEISQEIDQEIEAEIIEGLKKREFDEKIFYLGPGAEKFLDIIKSEEYELVNVELDLIKKHLKDLAPYLQKRNIYDLGAANAAKAIPLLEKQLESQEQADYTPVDINPAMVFAAAANINNDKVKVEGKILDFSKHLEGKLGKEPKLIALLGSTLGNGDQNWQKKLLQNISSAMTKEDNLLIGVHLKTNLQETLKMYKNPEGREFVMTTIENLGFAKDKVELDFVADEENRQIKVVIKIKEDMAVKGVEFKQNEDLTIFISQKYDVGELEKLAQSAGLEIDNSFMDEKNQYELAVIKKRK